MEKPKLHKFDSEEKTEKDFIISEEDDLPTEIRYASPLVISSYDNNIDPALLAKMSELKIKLN